MGTARFALERYGLLPTYIGKQPYFDANQLSPVYDYSLETTQRNVADGDDLLTSEGVTADPWPFGQDCNG